MVTWDERYAVLYEEIALALIEEREINKETVLFKAKGASERMFDGFRVDENFLQQLKRRIAELSNGKISLEKADSREFRTGIRGKAEYLKLIHSDGRVVRFILTPSSYESIEYDWNE